MSNTTNSVGIAKWADTQSIEIAWQNGTGDARQIGWTRADGARAIETNGDPVFEDAIGFDGSWETRGARPDFTDAALENIDETSADWESDLLELRAGKITREKLLETCLDGAEPDRVKGWRDYVAALVAAI